MSGVQMSGVQMSGVQMYPTRTELAVNLDSGYLTYYLNRKYHKRKCNIYAVYGYGIGLT